MKKLGKLTLKELETKVALICRTNQAGIIGGVSWSEYQSLESAGQWSGGYVDDWGYMGPTCCVCPSGNYYDITSISDWSSEKVMSFSERVASGVTGSIPAVGTVASVFQSASSNEAWQINTALLNAGLTGSDIIYIRFSPYEGGVYTVYNSGGTLIYQTE